MAKKCSICQKGNLIGGKRKKLRGKYNPVAKKVRKPNLQFFTLPSGKRILVCAKCKKILTKKMYK
jgi:ribosomal protein L28